MDTYNEAAILKPLILFVCFLSLSILAGLTPSSHCAELVIYHKPPVSETDYRQDFVFDIIQAVMDSTVETNGPYVMAPIPDMVWDRIRLPATQKAYPNLIIRITGSIKAAKGMEYIPIPINRGIVGYRICLIPESLQDKFNTISDLDDLVSSGLVAGQGRWTDVDILRENKVKVIVGGVYEGLFGMLMAKRFDYFPRGLNEVFQELETRQAKFPKMSVEQSLVLYYPLPRLLATTQGNHSLAKRIEKGLKAIFSNGIHQKIWMKYNWKWLKKARLDQRKIIVLKNSRVLPDLPFDQARYWYQPGEEHASKWNSSIQKKRGAKSS